VKVGEYIQDAGALLIREMSFNDLCKKHDDLMLEYDVDDLWEAFESKGPCFEALSGGKLIVLWDKGENR
jgi:hypothetical protein